jgi:hypothetical protein
MKNPTLEQIKERYPEGCEVACVYTLSDKRIVKYSDLYESRAGGFYLIMNKKDDVFLFSKNPDRFATITKEAPKSSFDNMFPDPDLEIQRIVKKYNLQPLKLSPQTESIAEALKNKIEQIEKKLNFDIINYINNYEK